MIFKNEEDGEKNKGFEYTISFREFSSIGRSFFI